RRRSWLSRTLVAYTTLFRSMFSNVFWLPKKQVCFLTKAHFVHKLFQIDVVSLPCVLAWPLLHSVANYYPKWYRLLNHHDRCCKLPHLDFYIFFLEEWLPTAF